LLEEGKISLTSIFGTRFPRRFFAALQLYAANLHYAVLLASKKIQGFLCRKGVKLALWTTCSIQRAGFSSKAAKRLPIV
jgi:hypothetical protein